MKLVALFALFALPVLANTPPEITNVRAGQRAGTKLVDIYYDAADADGDALKVRIEISDNDGVKYSVPAFSLTGDIGEGVSVGQNKHIVWDAGTDWDGEYSDKMRVKVFAIDAQGFPGLEWGNEVPPGGFLMGQDGGAEGSGPSRHVNIPWSYWLSKYEITVGQYCDFLNAALVSGYVEREGTTRVNVVPGMLPGINSTQPMIDIGDGQRIRWNVNNFEVVGGYTNHPVTVTWYGAMAFCRYYGYDLPTEAEWEKAARGPDHDDQDEHLVCPWGNDINASCANYNGGNTKPVGYYDGNQTPVGADMVNGYGLYDVIGNVYEWTRTYSGFSIESYEAEEVLDSSRNRAIGENSAYMMRGGSYVNRGIASNVIYYRNYGDATSRNSSGYSNTIGESGFRTIRRSCMDIASAKSLGKLSFVGCELGDVAKVQSPLGEFVVSNLTGKATIAKFKNEKVLLVNAGDCHLRFPKFTKKIRYVRLSFTTSVSNNDNNCVYLYSQFANGTTWGHRALGLSANEFDLAALYAREGAVSVYLRLYSYSLGLKVYLRDIEFFGTDD